MVSERVGDGNGGGRVLWSILYVLDHRLAVI